MILTVKVLYGKIQKKRRAASIAAENGNEENDLLHNDTCCYVFTAFGKSCGR